MINRGQPRPTIPVIALLALLAALLPGWVEAQELAGVALGPDDAPLANVPVVLHRVDAAGGAFIATDTTGPDGRFRFTLDADASAIYFAALRVDDRLYVGPTVPAGTEPPSGYVLRVEPGSEAGAVASALGGQIPSPAAARPRPGTGAGTGAGIGGGDSDAWALILVGLLALATAAAFVFAAPRYRQRRTRDALIELAATENALAEPDPDDRERLMAARDRLRKQLAPGS